MFVTTIRFALRKEQIRIALELCGAQAANSHLFTIQIEPSEENRKTLFQWTEKVCEYRLHMYFERKGQKLN